MKNWLKILCGGFAMCLLAAGCKQSDQLGYSNPMVTYGGTATFSSSTITTALNVPYITDGQIYYSDRGTAKGDSGLLFTSSTDLLTVGNAKITSNLYVTGTGIFTGAVTGTQANFRGLKVIDETSANTFATISNTSTAVTSFASLDMYNGALGTTESGHLYLTGTGYTSITGWQDAMIVAASSGLSGGLRLNSQASINMEVGGAGSSNVKATLATTGLAVTGSVTSSVDVVAGGNASSARAIVFAGTAAAPSYTFSADPDTGLYNSQANEIGFSVNGAQIMKVGTSSIRGPASNSLSLGSAANALANIYASGTSIYLSGLGAPGATADIVCWGADGLLTHQATNCTVSSAWFKENIKAMDSKALMEKVRKLRAVEYDLKDSGKREEGFVAEEMAMVDPSLVVFESTEDQERIAFIKNLYPEVVMEKDGKTFLPKTVDYARVSVLLTGAMQDMDSRVSALEKKTSTLDAFSAWLKSVVSN